MIVLAETDDERETLLEYFSAKLGVDKAVLVGKQPYVALAVVQNGLGVGGVLLTNYRRTSVEVAWAGDSGWLRRDDVRELFRYVFDTLGVMRAQGIIRRKNGASRRLAQRLGCREVGILENEYGPGEDGVLYSMTRSKCASWLR